MYSELWSYITHTPTDSLQKETYVLDTMYLGCFLRIFLPGNGSNLYVLNTSFHSLIQTASIIQQDYQL